MDAGSSKPNRDAKSPLEIPPEITLDVADKFCPLRTDASESWRTTLEELHQRFSESADNQEKLTCVLTHSVVPEWPSRPDGPYPSEVDGMEPIAMGDGPSRWPQQFFLRKENQTETVVSELEPMSEQSYRLKMLDISSKLRFGDVQYAPIVGDSAVQNVTGNPILFSNGQPVAMRRGINRNYFIHAGGKAHERIKSITSFFSIASQAGQCLDELPPAINRIVWHDWLDGFRSIGDKGMWICALFELAWQQAPGSSLAAERFAWSGATSTPLDAFPPTREQTETGGAIDELTDTDDSPAHWYSVIENLASASIAALEILLAISDDDDSSHHEPTSTDA